MSPTRERSARRHVALAATTAVALAPLVVAPLTPAPAAAAETAAAVVEQSFDFGTATSPVAAGHTRVTGATRYADGAGYGLSASVATRDRGAPDALRRDFTVGTATFSTDVPDGTYWVTVTSGDQIASNTTTLAVERVAQDDLRSSTGEFAVWSERVVVSDGRLDVAVARDGRLNGVTVSSLLPPTGLTADVDVAADGGSVASHLAWDAVDGAEGYRVYRSLGAGGSELVGETTAPSYTDADPAIDLGDRLTYTVTQVVGGHESSPAAAAAVTAYDDDVVPPATPASLEVTDVAEHAVSLAWEPVDGALLYQVFRRDRSGELAPLARVTEPRYTDTDVLTTVGYTYAVAALNAGGASEPSATVTSDAVTTLSRQAERLGRAPVAAATGADGVYVGWRMLGDDPDDVAFHVYRDGERITDTPLTGATNLVDPDGTTGSTYRVATIDAAGIERWATHPFAVWDGQTTDVPLDRPAGGTTPDGVDYTYAANDASVGDVDGDGEYEIVLKWDPSNSKDNSQSGYTGNVYLDAYELDGTLLWRVDLGRNIRAGAHYTQFQVFDYDGDGRAEVMAKTADGTVDGAGTVIGDAAADHRSSRGYVLSGPEFLTVFEGATGAAVDTVDYVPARGNVGSWGDTYGNRVDRFLAGTAYLDGEHPSAVFARGYYTRAVVAAFDFDGESIAQRWVFDSDEAGDEYEGQGNHALLVADVDGDQKDEIVYGSMTLDDDGTALYNTRLGHGDAQHVGDLDPSRPGLEVFSVHEDMGASGHRGGTFRDAGTGEVLWSIPADGDTGRGASADIDPTRPGAEAWAAGEVRSAAGEVIADSAPPANFVTWWDGDVVREIGDHDYDREAGAGVPTIAKWDPATQQDVEIYRATGTLTSNTTKGNYALQADLFGDWREEIVTRTDDSTALRISTTVIPTDVRLRTLMSDPQYRLAVAWQNTGYNQPPHPSYFLGEGMEAPTAPRLAFTTDAPPAERVPGPASAAPGAVRVHVDDVEDGRIRVEARIGSGDNAQEMSLLVDGETVDTVELLDRSPEEQEAKLEATGVEDGRHEVVVVARNQHGETSSRATVVRLR